MEIEYRTGAIQDIELVIDLYQSAELNRPVKDKSRIVSMYENSNLVISAWYGEVLVGIARSLTDFCYCCYLSDLAVRKEFQNSGIGRTLIEKTKSYVGNQSMLLLLSAPSAIDYYPKAGFKKVENGFIIDRTC